MSLARLALRSPLYTEIGFSKIFSQFNSPFTKLLLFGILTVRAVSFLKPSTYINRSLWSRCRNRSGWVPGIHSPDLQYQEKNACCKHQSRSFKTKWFSLSKEKAWQFFLSEIGNSPQKPLSISLRHRIMKPNPSFPLACHPKNRK